MLTLKQLPLTTLRINWLRMHDLGLMNSPPGNKKLTNVIFYFLKITVIFLPNIHILNMISFSIIFRKAKIP